MAVVGTAQEMPDSPEGGFELGKLEVRRHFLVIVDSRTDGPLVAASASGLPSLFSAYSFGGESHPYMRARRYESSRIGGAATLAWKVTVVYSTPEQKSGSGGGGGGSSGGGTGTETDGEFLNPLLERPTVKIHTSGREIPLMRIYDTLTNSVKPCTASNGQVFDPPPKTLERVMTLEIARNESIATAHPSLALQYLNTCNSDTFWGMGAGIWLCKGINPERQERTAPSGAVFPFLRTTYTFEARPEGWDLYLLDYGDFSLETTRSNSLADTAPLERRAITTTDNHPTSGLLNGRGGALPDKMPVTAESDSGLLTTRANTSGSSFRNGDLVQLTNIGGALPDGLVAYRNYYIKDPNPSGGGQAFSLSLTSGGAAVEFDDDGTGRHYIGSPGIFFTIRPFARRTYAALGLPNNFMSVQ